MIAFLIDPLRQVADTVEVNDWLDIKHYVPDMSFRNIEFQNEESKLVVIENIDQDSRIVSVVSRITSPVAFGRILIMSDSEQNIVESLTEEQITKIRQHIITTAQENRSTRILNI